MQRSSHFHPRTPRWCWGIALLAAVMVLPGAGVVAEPGPDAESDGTKKLDFEKGGGTLFKWAPVGSWVKFKTVGRGERSGQVYDRTSFITMRCVGTEVVDGQRARWIEFENQPNLERGDRKIIWKLLIPEAVLEKGQRPMEHLLAAWQKLDEDAPQRLEIPVPRSVYHAGFLYATMPGPLDNPKELEPLVVESKLGKLACQNVVGTLESARSRISFRVRLHAKAPFGSVSQIATVVYLADGEKIGEIVFTSDLIDFGTGAKSALPDAGVASATDRSEGDESTRLRRPTVATSTAEFDSESEVIETLEGLNADFGKDDDGHVVRVTLRSNTQFSDADLQSLVPQLQSLSRLHTLDLSNTSITNDGLTNLTELKALTRLHLSNCDITDEGLEHVKTITQLTGLWLDGTKVTDQGTSHLAALRDLTHLNLGGTKVGDTAMKRITELTTLTFLYLSGTQVLTMACSI